MTKEQDCPEHIEAMMMEHNDFIEPWTLRYIDFDVEGQTKHSHPEYIYDICIDIESLYQFYVSLRKSNIPEDIILLMVEFIPPDFDGHCDNEEEMMLEWCLSQWEYLSEEEYEQRQLYFDNECEACCKERYPDCMVFNQS